VTQADINSGVDIVNTANVSFASGVAVAPQIVTATVRVVQNKAFTVTKSVNKQTTAAANDALRYTIVVSNTGNTDLPNLVLTDNLLTPAQLVCSPIQPGQTLPAFTGTTTCTGTYTTTQDDINSGAPIVNQVTAQLGGVPTQTATATTTVLQNRALSITKAANVNVVSQAGSVIQYSIVVRNVGNVDAQQLSVIDGRIQGGLLCTPTILGGTLLVGASTTCTGTYTVSQDDMDSGRPHCQQRHGLRCSDGSRQRHRHGQHPPERHDDRCQDCQLGVCERVGHFVAVPDHDPEHG
jgi:uncharacterized repeat protein (TIGR01451 family)